MGGDGLPFSVPEPQIRMHKDIAPPRPSDESGHIALQRQSDRLGLSPRSAPCAPPDIRAMDFKAAQRQLALVVNYDSGILCVSQVNMVQSNIISTNSGSYFAISQSKCGPSLSREVTQPLALW